VPACEANHTGWLTFGNRSGSITYDAYLNGSRIATIAPGQSSPTQTVAAAVAQHMIWRVTNTSIVACTADPIVTQCGSQTIGC
jgi:homospermidine synthase